MKTKEIIAAVAFSCILTGIQAQALKSEKAYLQFKSEPEKESTQVADRTPPQIRMMTPAVGNRAIHVSDEPEIVLIGKVTDDGGISSLLVDSKPTEITEDGVFTRKLELNAGQNEVVIVAMDKNDNFVDFRFSIEYAPPRVSLADKVSQESKYYALIIGINNYSDPAIRSLDNAIADAENLYKVLTERYTFDKENIQFWKDAKREDIIYSLDHFSRVITPNDNLLIFYAGHGTFDENSNVGYWLPSDSKKITKADWFRNSTLVDYLKEINSKHTLLITDACFGGSIFNTRAAFLDASKAIEKLYELPSRKAMTSGTLTEVPDRSSFSKFLVERLDENREKYLSSEQLFSSLRIAVINNSDAVPQYGEIRNVGDEGGDFIFIRK